MVWQWYVIMTSEDQSEAMIFSSKCLGDRGQSPQLKNEWNGSASMKVTGELEPDSHFHPHRHPPPTDHNIAYAPLYLRDGKGDRWDKFEPLLWGTE